MTLSVFIASTLAIITGSIVQVLTGVGGGFIAVPILAWLDLSLVPAPLVFASMSLSGTMMIREWHAIDWLHIPAILAGLIPGAVAGAWVLAAIPSDRLGIIFGVVLILGILLTVSGRKLSLTHISGALVGSLCGAMGASTGMGAPPLALLYQHHSGATIRATLAALYTGASLMILIILFGFGKFGVTETLTGLYLVPGYVIGYLLARRKLFQFGDQHARAAVLVVSGATAIALIYRSL
ncbi:MAG: sulfite exporter TauE/SafE family protein [Gammaproteobacteria bacterium]|nr:sulfite exporter TauE/SafE family protein [Gammaproteobacteria bacterium]